MLCQLPAFTVKVKGENGEKTEEEACFFFFFFFNEPWEPLAVKQGEFNLAALWFQHISS